MYRIFTLISVLCFAGIVSGCASIVSNSKYPIAVSSEPNEATFKIVNTDGQIVYRGKTPTFISLKSGDGYFKRAKYQILFEKEGYQPTTSYIEADFDVWYAGNILFFGGDLFLGFLVIDPATGAMWKLDENVFVELLPEVESQAVP